MHNMPGEPAQSSKQQNIIHKEIMRVKITSGDDQGINFSFIDRILDVETKGIHDQDK